VEVAEHSELQCSIVATRTIRRL